METPSIFHEKKVDQCQIFYIFLTTVVAFFSRIATISKKKNDLNLEISRVFWGLSLAFGE